MKGSGIPVVFTPNEISSMWLRNGAFSLTRFKRTIRGKVRKLLSGRIGVSGDDDSDLVIGRIAVRNIDRKTPKNFTLDVSYMSDDGIRWRQVFLYVFGDSRQSLNGFLVPGRKRHAK
jgi:hypothetical protein